MVGLRPLFSQALGIGATRTFRSYEISLIGAALERRKAKGKTPKLLGAEVFTGPAYDLAAESLVKGGRPLIIG
jgi:hypothetical protein